MNSRHPEVSSWLIVHKLHSWSMIIRTHPHIYIYIYIYICVCVCVYTRSHTYLTEQFILAVETVNKCFSNIRYLFVLILSILKWAIATYTETGLVNIMCVCVCVCGDRWMSTGTPNNKSWLKHSVWFIRALISERQHSQLRLQYILHNVSYNYQSETHILWLTFY